MNARDDAIITALTRENWTQANRELLAKAITELLYEEVIDPDITDDGELRWELPDGTLTGRARRRTLGWWRVDPGSLGWCKTEAEAIAPPHATEASPIPGPSPTAEQSPATSSSPAPEQSPAAGSANPAHTPSTGSVPDAVDLLAGVLSAHGAAPPTVANLVSELSSTLLSDTLFLANARPAASLVDLEPVLVESELRGHPWIVANKGRVGFDVDDLLSYAPEASRDVQLLWLAADPSIADVATVAGLDHHTAVREQVGAECFARLLAGASLGGLNPDTCVILPVHPWQWSHRIMTLYAAELARGTLVVLGEGTARYRPQLAIRTMTDIDFPERRYLKLPLSILNTSVYRGLPRERTLAAPALTEWLAGIVAADSFFAETGLILLGEVAGVSVGHRTYETLPGVPYQHTEMLGAIWREPVQGYLRGGERAVSLAALLHVDPSGGSFAQALAERSGLPPVEWLRHLHEAVLPPLFHVLYRYGAMFSPHGQNCMIAHKDGVPTRLIVKDFVDDLAICSEPLPELADLAPNVRRALSDVTLEAKTLIKYLQNGLLICVYRYLAEISESHLGVPEPEFWAGARRVLADYQARFADDLADRFALFDLQTETFPKLCLNRLRLFERGYDDDAERPVISAAGSVANPLWPGFPAGQ